MVRFKKIHLERTMCYGMCPVYHLEIAADGTVDYYGMFFVAKSGHHTWKLDSAAIKKLNSEIKKSEFFTMEEIEDSSITTDLPGCNTEILFEDGTSRKIEHKYGYIKFPDGLKILEDKIDELAGVKKYVENPKT
jgi:VCBS repeat-containing protein